MHLWRRNLLNVQHLTRALAVTDDRARTKLPSQRGDDDDDDDGVAGLHSIFVD